MREVIPEYSIGNGRVDYCLKLGSQIAAFIEVKRTGEPLEKHQEQLLGYAFRQGVKLAILTDGVLWWFYLPLSQGSWEQRRFIAIDIRQQELPTAAKHFSDFLAREAIQNGEAVRRAESIHASGEKKRLIRQTIPRAWADLCEGPDELLLELLADKVESLCGHRPEVEDLTEYVSHQVCPQRAPALPPVMSRVRAAGPAPSTAAHNAPVHPGGYTFKVPTIYTFLGETYPVRTFKEILLGLTKAVWERHPHDIRRAFDLRGRKRPYFSDTPENMNNPVEVPHAGIWVETCLSANAVVDRCYELIQHFGYRKEDLKIECASRPS